MSDEKLLPCPFCEFSGVELMASRGRNYVWCSACGAIGPVEATVSEAVTAWTKRTGHNQGGENV